MYASPETHHGAGRAGVWINSTPINQQLLLHAEPRRYFAPPYVGGKGWLGVVLDDAADWPTLADLLRDAWRLTAPRRLAASLPED